MTCPCGRPVQGATLCTDCSDDELPQVPVWRCTECDMAIYRLALDGNLLREPPHPLIQQTIVKHLAKHEEDE